MLILLLLSVSLVMVGGKMEVGVVEKEGEVSSEDWQIMAEEEEWNQKKEDRMADTKIAEPNGEQVEEEERVFVSDIEPWLQYRLTMRPKLNRLEQGDDRLLEEIHRNYLVAPSVTKGYNSSSISEDIGESYGEFGQDAFLDAFLFKGEVENGFFIEAGADDFVGGSNSLMFERAHGWTGLLVEPHPTQFFKGLHVQRKALSVATCLATATRPHFSRFAVEVAKGKMAGLVPDSWAGNGFMELQCLPLGSLILAMGNPTVNYLSLDLEGAEMQVLESLPWSKVNIEVISAEVNLLGSVFPGSRQGLHSLMSTVGYTYIGSLEHDDFFVMSRLLGNKYSFDMTQGEDWPEYSFNVEDNFKRNDFKNAAESV